MTDTELFALAVYVGAFMFYVGFTVSQILFKPDYKLVSKEIEEEIESELKRRGVLPGGKG